jgi:putative transcriptional regulator
MKNRLKELRQLCQWSQADLARELKVSRQAVNGFESGKFDPSLDMALKVANLFGVALEDVFIYEAKNTMQTFVERFTSFLGFEFGFERFTDTAIGSMKFAQNEAVRSQKSQIEPEHIFAGLLSSSSTTAARLLQAAGATLNIKPNEQPFELKESHHDLKLSSESKFVVELALQIVRLQGKKSIGTEHLLWGLIRLAETHKGTVSLLLAQSKIDLERLNTQLIEVV